MRRGPVIAALLGWVVVIIVGAGRESDTSVWLGIENLDAVYMVILAAVALLGLVLLIWSRPTLGDWRVPPKRKTGIWIFPFIVLALLLWRPEILANLTQAQDTAEQVLDGLDIPEETAPEIAEEPVAQVAHILALLGIVAAIAAVWVWTSRTADDADPTRGSAGFDVHDIAVDAQLQQVIRASARELSDETDPRQAVLCAYATLESEFQDRGQPRVRSETASEHLGRVMTPLAIDAGPFVELGKLYEIARFSAREVTIDDQQRAASSLANAQRSFVAER